MAKIVSAIILSVICLLCINCGESQYLSLEEMKYVITDDSLEVLNVTSNDLLAPPKETNVSIQPSPSYTVPQEYPEDLRIEGKEGSVRVKLWITKMGDVKRAVILESNEKGFNRTAMETAIQWHFNPAISKTGDNIDVWVAIVLNYRITK